MRWLFSIQDKERRALKLKHTKYKKKTINQFTGNKQENKQTIRPKYFSVSQLAGSSSAILCQSMTCLLPQIVTQVQNTQLSLGVMPSNSQLNHRPQSPSCASALLMNSCCIHPPCTKHICKHCHGLQRV